MNLTQAGAERIQRDGIDAIVSDGFGDPDVLKVILFDAQNDLFLASERTELKAGSTVEEFGDSEIVFVIERRVARIQQMAIYKVGQAQKRPAVQG